MGRDLRRVPPNWEHPKGERRNGQIDFLPMFDKSYSEAIEDWIEQHELWKQGKHPDQLDGSGSHHKYYAQWGGNPPDVEYYRPDWKPEEMTWWQVYENVSEGTPVTPPFATREELVEYLVANGDLWDQRRRAEGRSIINCEPWTRKQAESFVFGNGYAPSFVVVGGEIKSGVEAMAELTPPLP